MEKRLPIQRSPFIILHSSFGNVLLPEVVLRNLFAHVGTRYPSCTKLLIVFLELRVERACIGSASRGVVSVDVFLLFSTFERERFLAPVSVAILSLPLSGIFHLLPQNRQDGDVPPPPPSLLGIFTIFLHQLLSCCRLGCPC